MEDYTGRGPLSGAPPQASAPQKQEEGSSSNGKSRRHLPGVEHIKADRENANAFAAALEAAAKSQPWVGVVDFSAYKRRHVKAALEGLRNTGFGIYVHISTDSVYEVSDASAWEGAPFVVEEHARRPADKQKAWVLNQKDSYAHHKLKCEEHLRQFAAEFKRPVVALRLADVIGPFDDTHRLWAYWWWCRYSNVLSPVLVDDDGASQPLNFTFTGDVAAVVCLFIRQAANHQSTLPQENCSFKPYNLVRPLGFIAQLAACMRAASSSEALAVQVSNERMAFPVLLPSVCRRVPLSMKRIKTELGLQTLTPLREAIRQTCKWFEEACVAYPEQARAALRKLPKAARLEALKTLKLETSGSSSSNSSNSSSSSDEGSSNDEDSSNS
ncbi:hypothetical protein Esti_000700 [Eimeria stiedai]